MPERPGKTDSVIEQEILLPQQLIDLMSSMLNDPPSTQVPRIKLSKSTRAYIRELKANDEYKKAKVVREESISWILENKKSAITEKTIHTLTVGKLLDTFGEILKAEDEVEIATLALGATRLLRNTNKIDDDEMQELMLQIYDLYSNKEDDIINEYNKRRRYFEKPTF